MSAKSYLQKSSMKIQPSATAIPNRGGWTCLSGMASSSNRLTIPPSRERDRTIANNDDTMPLAGHDSRAGEGAVGDRV